MKHTELSDEEVDAGFRETYFDEQRGFVSNLEFLAEMDRRRLYFHCSSLWAYLIQEYRIDGSSAFRRIRAARLFLKFPELGVMLESGQLNLSLVEIAEVCASREGLCDGELWELLESVSGMSCSGARRECARRYPRAVELPRDRIRPLTEELSEVRFVATAELLEKLDEIRGLLAHSHPGIPLGELIEVLASEYRERHHPEARARRAEERARRAGESAEEQPGRGAKQTEERVELQKLNETLGSLPTSAVESRSPAQSVVHALTRQRGYRCSYKDPVTGQSCTSTYGLEIDHIQAWSLGGRTELKNLRYLCRGHHRRVSFLQFGARKSAAVTDDPPRSGSP